MLWHLARPFLFRLPAETSHELVKAGMRRAQRSDAVRSQVRSRYQYRHPALQVEAFGLTFPNPVTIAPGFDKNGEVSPMLADLGFGSTTLGTVTPRPQPGNPKPRLFRLIQDKALINRFALPNEGADAVSDRLGSMPHPGVPVGVVIDKMNTSDAAQGIDDNREVFEKLYDYADYFITSFCPNTPDNYETVKNDEGTEYMADIFEELQDANDEDKPILVRAGRDPRRERLQTIVDVVERHDLDGFMTMTPETRDRQDLNSPHRYETGNLTGRPVERSSTDVVRMMYRMTDLPIVGVGGVDSAESAYQKIRAGASMVALYTGFIYGGPALASQINSGLVRLLEQDGFSSVSEAVGTGVAEDDEVSATV